MRTEWVEWAIGIAVVFFVFELVSSANAGQSTPLLPTTSISPTNQLNSGILGTAAFVPVSSTALGLASGALNGAQSILVNGTTSNPISPSSVFGGDFGM